MSIKIFNKIPAGFCIQVEVASCYFFFEGKLLLLQRGKSKSEEGYWGAPAGKIEAEETPLEGMKRELFEETGIQLTDIARIEELKPLYMRKPEISYVYHMFRYSASFQPEIVLTPEHQNYGWFAFQEITQLPLMAGAEESLAYLNDSYCRQSQ